MPDHLLILATVVVLDVFAIRWLFSIRSFSNVFKLIVIGVVVLLPSFGWLLCFLAAVYLRSNLRKP
jgi:hypothetical protein